MKHGLFEAIINFFKNINHSDAVTFTKGAVVGGVGTFYVLLDVKMGGADRALEIAIKLMYISGTALLTGMCVTIGKKIIDGIHKWFMKRKFKKHGKPKEKDNEKAA